MHKKNKLKLILLVLYLLLAGFVALTLQAEGTNVRPLGADYRLTEGDLRPVGNRYQLAEGNVRPVGSQYQLGDPAGDMIQFAQTAD